MALFILLAVLVPLSSCSARIDGRLVENGTLTVLLDASLQPKMASLMGKLSGSGSDAVLLDAAGLAASLRQAPGVAAADLRNPDPRRVAGTVLVTDLNRFLSATGPGKGQQPPRFVDYESSAAAGRILVRLDHGAAPALLALLSPDVVDYLAALMAPAATGEVLSRDEYLDLVRSVYGDGIAAELREASIKVVLEVPGTVVAVRSGSFSGSRATVSVPLLAVLVLDRPFEYEVSWKP